MAREGYARLRSMLRCHAEKFGMEIALFGLRQVSGILPHPHERLYKLEKEGLQVGFREILAAESM